MNLVGLVRTARLLGPGHTLLTFLCDSGQRHLTRYAFLEFINIFRFSIDPILPVLGIKRIRFSK